MTRTQGTAQTKGHPQRPSAHNISAWATAMLQGRAQKSPALPIWLRRAFGIISSGYEVKAEAAPPQVDSGAADLGACLAGR